MNKHEAEKEFARAAQLAEQGQYADAEQVRASAETDYERANGRPYSPLDDTPEAPPLSEYDHQAQAFLTANGLRLRATLSDSKPAPWSPAGHHYRVSLWREKLKGEMVAPYQGLNRITFDFWSGSQPTAYDVLACIASDAYTPDTFEEFCDYFGADPDSLKELQAFRRCASFARRLRAFFTPSELDQLSAIQ